VLWYERCLTVISHHLQSLNTALLFSSRQQTYSGLFLVAVNPYKYFPIYTPEIIDRYTARRKNEVAPHIFATADTAYRAMLENRRDQSLLITYVSLYSALLLLQLSLSLSLSLTTQFTQLHKLTFFMT
jgi:hypothetical protein